MEEKEQSGKDSMRRDSSAEGVLLRPQPPLLPSAVGAASSPAPQLSCSSVELSPACSSPAATGSAVVFIPAAAATSAFSSSPPPFPEGVSTAPASSAAVLGSSVSAGLASPPAGVVAAASASSSVSASSAASSSSSAANASSLLPHLPSSAPSPMISAPAALEADFSSAATSAASPPHPVLTASADISSCTLPPSSTGSSPPFFVDAMLPAPSPSVVASPPSTVVSPSRRTSCLSPLPAAAFKRLLPHYTPLLGQLILDTCGFCVISSPPAGFCSSGDPEIQQQQSTRKSSGDTSAALLLPVAVAGSTGSRDAAPAAAASSFSSGRKIGGIGKAAALGGLARSGKRGKHARVEEDEEDVAPVASGRGEKGRRLGGGERREEDREDDGMQKEAVGPWTLPEEALLLEPESSEFGRGLGQAKEAAESSNSGSSGVTSGNPSTGSNSNGGAGGGGGAAAAGERYLFCNSPVNKVEQQLIDKVLQEIENMGGFKALGNDCLEAAAARAAAAAAGVATAAAAAAETPFLRAAAASAKKAAEAAARRRKVEQGGGGGGEAKGGEGGDTKGGREGVENKEEEDGSNAGAAAALVAAAAAAVEAAAGAQTPGEMFMRRSPSILRASMQPEEEDKEENEEAEGRSCAWVEQQVLRFLYCTAFDIPKTIELLKSSLAFRCSRLPVSLEDVLKEIRDEGVAYWHGRDRALRPLLVIRVDSMQQLQQRKGSKDVDDDPVTRVLVFSLEFFLRYLCVAGRVESWCILCDCRGTSFSSFPVPLLFRLLSLLQACYRGRLHRFYLLNSPRLFHVLARSLLCSIPASSAKKVRIFSSSEDWKAERMRCFAKHQLEKKYGGDQPDIAKDWFPYRFFPGPFEPETKPEEIRWNSPAYLHREVSPLVHVGYSLHTTPSSSFAASLACSTASGKGGGAASLRNGCVSLPQQQEQQEQQHSQVQDAGGEAAAGGGGDAGGEKSEAIIITKKGVRLPDGRLALWWPAAAALSFPRCTTEWLNARFSPYGAAGPSSPSFSSLAAETTADSGAAAGVKGTTAARAGERGGQHMDAAADAATVTSASEQKTAEEQQLVLRNGEVVRTFVGNAAAAPELSTSLPSDAGAASACPPQPLGGAAGKAGSGAVCAAESRKKGEAFTEKLTALVAPSGEDGGECAAFFEATTSLHQLQEKWKREVDTIRSFFARFETDSSCFISSSAPVSSSAAALAGSGAVVLPASAPASTCTVAAAVAEGVSSAAAAAAAESAAVVVEAGAAAGEAATSKGGGEEHGGAPAAESEAGTVGNVAVEEAAATAGEVRAVAEAEERALELGGEAAGAGSASGNGCSTIGSVGESGAGKAVSIREEAGARGDPADVSLQVSKAAGRVKPASSNDISSMDVSVVEEKENDPKQGKKLLFKEQQQQRGVHSFANLEGDGVFACSGFEKCEAAVARGLTQATTATAAGGGKEEETTTPTTAERPTRGAGKRGGGAAASVLGGGTGSGAGAASGGPGTAVRVDGVSAAADDGRKTAVATAAAMAVAAAPPPRVASIDAGSHGGPFAAEGGPLLQVNSVGLRSGSEIVQKSVHSRDGKGVVSQEEARERQQEQGQRQHEGHPSELQNIEFFGVASSICEGAGESIAAAGQDVGGKQQLARSRPTLPAEVEFGAAEPLHEEELQIAAAAAGGRSSCSNCSLQEQNSRTSCVEELRSSRRCSSSSNAEGEDGRTSGKSASSSSSSTVPQQSLRSVEEGATAAGAAAVALTARGASAVAAVVVGRHPSEKTGGGARDSRFAGTLSAEEGEEEIQPAGACTSALNTAASDLNTRSEGGGTARGRRWCHALSRAPPGYSVESSSLQEGTSDSATVRGKSRLSALSAAVAVASPPASLRTSQRTLFVANIGAASTGDGSSPAAVAPSAVSAAEERVEDSALDTVTPAAAPTPAIVAASAAAAYTYAGAASASNSEGSGESSSAAGLLLSSTRIPLRKAHACWRNSSSYFRRQQGNSGSEAAERGGKGGCATGKEEVAGRDAAEAAPVGAECEKETGKSTIAASDPLSGAAGEKASPAGGCVLITEEMNSFSRDAATGKERETADGRKLSSDSSESNLPLEVAEMAEICCPNSTAARARGDATISMTGGGLANSCEEYQQSSAVSNQEKTQKAAALATAGERGFRGFIAGGSSRNEETLVSYERQAAQGNSEGKKHTGGRGSAEASGQEIEPCYSNSSSKSSSRTNTSGSGVGGGDTTSSSEKGNSRSSSEWSLSLNSRGLLLQLELEGKSEVKLNAVESCSTAAATSSYVLEDDIFPYAAAAFPSRKKDSIGDFPASVSRLSESLLPATGKRADEVTKGQQQNSDRSRGGGEVLPGGGTLWSCENPIQERASSGRSNNKEYSSSSIHSGIGLRLRASGGRLQLGAGPVSSSSGSDGGQRERESVEDVTVPPSSTSAATTTVATASNGVGLHLVHDSQCKSPQELNKLAQRFSSHATLEQGENNAVSAAADVPRGPVLMERDRGSLQSSATLPRAIVSPIYLTDDCNTSSLSTAAGAAAAHETLHAGGSVADFAASTALYTETATSASAVVARHIAGLEQKGVSLDALDVRKCSYSKDRDTDVMSRSREEDASCEGSGAVVKQRRSLSAVSLSVSSALRSEEGQHCGSIAAAARGRGRRLSRRTSDSLSSEGSSEIPSTSSVEVGAENRSVKEVAATSGRKAHASVFFRRYKNRRASAFESVCAAVLPASCGLPPPPVAAAAPAAGGSARGAAATGASEEPAAGMVSSSSSSAPISVGAVQLQCPANSFSLASGKEGGEENTADAVVLPHLSETAETGDLSGRTVFKRRIVRRAVRRAFEFCVDRAPAEEPFVSAESAVQPGNRGSKSLQSATANVTASPVSSAPGSQSVAPSSPPSTSSFAFRSTFVGAASSLAAAAAAAARAAAAGSSGPPANGVCPSAAAAPGAKDDVQEKAAVADAEVKGAATQRKSLFPTSTPACSSYNNAAAEEKARRVTGTPSAKIAMGGSWHIAAATVEKQPCRGSFDQTRAVPAAMSSHCSTAASALTAAAAAAATSDAVPGGTTSGKTVAHVANVACFDTAASHPDVFANAALFATAAVDDNKEENREKRECTTSDDGVLIPGARREESGLPSDKPLELAVSKLPHDFTPAMTSTDDTFFAVVVEKGFAAPTAGKVERKGMLEDSNVITAGETATVPGTVVQLLGRTRVQAVAETSLIEEAVPIDAASAGLTSSVAALNGQEGNEAVRGTTQTAQQRIEKERRIHIKSGRHLWSRRRRYGDGDATGGAEGAQCLSHSGSEEEDKRDQQRQPPQKQGDYAAAGAVALGEEAFVLASDVPQRTTASLAIAERDGKKSRRREVVKPFLKPLHRRLHRTESYEDKVGNVEFDGGNPLVNLRNEATVVRRNESEGTASLFCSQNKVNSDKIRRDRGTSDTGGLTLEGANPRTSALLVEKAAPGSIARDRNLGCSEAERLDSSSKKSLESDPQAGGLYEATTALQLKVEDWSMKDAGRKDPQGRNIWEETEAKIEDDGEAEQVSDTALGAAATGVCNKGTLTQRRDTEAAARNSLGGVAPGAVLEEDDAVNEEEEEGNLRPGNSPPRARQGGKRTKLKSLARRLLWQ